MNSFQLRETQRGIIRNQSEPDNENTERKTVVGDDEVTDTDGVEVNTSDNSGENSRFYLPKCMLLMVGLLILLAGMSVLIYLYKDERSGSRGEVLPNKEPKEECPQELYVSLGESIVITCTMNNDIPGDVVATYANLLGASNEDFHCIIENKTNVACTSKVGTKCSTSGEINVQFYDGVGEDKRVISTEVVKIKVSDIFPKTTIEQVLNNDTPEFQLQCSYSGDCTSYEVGFYERDTSLADSVSCTTRYSDREGYNVNCNAVVSGNVILELGNGSELYCYLMHGSVIKKETKLELPACNDIDANNKNCSGNTTSLFACSNLSDITEDCNKTCELAEQCFSAREYKIHSTDCEKECKLKWCREKDTLEIDASGTISFNHLCDIT